MSIFIQAYLLAVLLVWLWYPGISEIQSQPKTHHRQDASCRLSANHLLCARITLLKS